MGSSLACRPSARRATGRAAASRGGGPPQISVSGSMSRSRPQTIVPHRTPNRPEPLVVAAKRLKHRSPQSVSQTSLDLLPVAEPQPDPIVVEWCHGLDGQHGPMLAERRNLVRWQLSAREFPVRLQLGLVHHRPLDDQPQHAAGQLPTQHG